MVIKSKNCERLNKSAMQCGFYMCSVSSTVLRMEIAGAIMTDAGTPFMTTTVKVKACTTWTSLSVLRTPGTSEISTLSM